MNDPVVTARVLLCLLAVIPSFVGYYWTKYYEYFPRRSLRQFALMLVVLFLFMGPAVFQRHVYFVVGHISKADMFATILFIAQYFFASVIMIVSLTKREAATRSEGENKSSISKHD